MNFINEVFVYLASTRTRTRTSASGIYYEYIPLGYVYFVLSTPPLLPAYFTVQLNDMFPVCVPIMDKLSYL